jgi:predicted DNA-binding transcriptional regulator AlpA
MSNLDVLNVLRAKDAAKFLGIGLSTFWRWVADGKIKQGIHLGSRVTVWERTTLEKFIADATEKSAVQGGVK